MWKKFAVVMLGVSGYLLRVFDSGGAMFKKYHSGYMYPGHNALLCNSGMSSCLGCGRGEGLGQSEAQGDGGWRDVCSAVVGIVNE